MIKDTPIYQDDITAMQQEFESGIGFNAEDKVLESGIYNVFHDSRITHVYQTVVTLDKGDSFPTCLNCKPLYRIFESKSYQDVVI